MLVLVVMRTLEGRLKQAAMAAVILPSVVAVRTWSPPEPAAAAVRLIPVLEKPVVPVVPVADLLVRRVLMVVRLVVMMPAVAVVVLKVPVVPVVV
jgi:hypothetical protein